MLLNADKAAYRSFHHLMRIAVKRLPFGLPTVLSGPDSIDQLADNITMLGLRHALLVTDRNLSKLGLPDGLHSALEKRGVGCSVYDEVQPDPTVGNVEQGVALYRDFGCDCIIGFGGGSSMDCAKIIGARLANPFLSIRRMKGYLRVLWPLPPLFCVPTTAGTGSEATIVGVIKDDVTHEKLVVTDPKLLPQIAVLSGELMVDLPNHITAATGMDALTHAVESFIGINGNEFTDFHAQKATRLIMEHLPEAYENGANLHARQQMAVASFCAGAAFTRAFVGYVHAIAHNVGAVYGVAHGLANAVALAPVLKFYGEDAHKKLAELALAAGIGYPSQSTRALATAFIERIEQMNTSMNIPTKMPQVRERDIPMLAKRILKEAHPDYPVPRFMTNEQCQQMLAAML